ncbi:nitroreductase family protein [Streptacidiphilus sp. EB103A]|uniref:nitroreductase family protein n=1 Tax=Streptacidiphilus sp. EB103A TaxID=3156275 RepID=UPI003514A4E3
MTDPMRTALATAYAHGPGKSIQASNRTVRPDRYRAAHSVALGSLADIPDFGPALVRTLTAALAPHRWEPWNPHNDHRAYPSPRCVYLTDAALRLGEHRWPIDPVRLLLEGERRLPDPSTVTSATVELTVEPHRLSDGYGTLRDALALLEAGHLSSALVEAGRANGLAVHASPQVGGGGSGVVAEVTIRHSTAVTWPWQQVSAARSSALGPRGLSADPRPLPAGVLQRLLQDSRPPTGSLAGRRGGGALRHRLAVRGVTGFTDGLYELGEGGLMALRPGQATQGIQSAFRFGPADIDVTGMNVVWVISADVDDVIRGQGPDGYTNALLSAGAAAQHVCSAAAAAGLFCRPVRSLDEPATEAAVQADIGEDIVYMLLVGRPRAQDFCYDLTDPEEPTWQ